MISLNDLVDGAAFRADMQYSNRVLQAEWVKLLREAINSAWNLAASARPDFQFKSFDFSLNSGVSASVDVRTFGDFHSLIDVVFGPDTSNEYSLGPFNWQNRRSPGGWFPYALLSNLIGYGGTRASLRGFLIYVEPSIQAAGAYRAWYCPRPHVPNVVVRLATAVALPACVAAGVGIGKTLTASVAAALSVDGQAVFVNDLVLVKNQAAPADNGVYVVTNAGGGVAWVLTRATAWDETTDMVVGDIVAVGQSDPSEPVGATNEKKFFTLATFTAIESAQTFTEGAALEQILEQFSELVTLKTALPAMMRDGGSATTSSSDFTKRLEGPDGKGGLIFEMKQYFAMVRSNAITKMVDTDAVGLGGWRGGL